jgi:hypothetical protein
MLQVAGTHIMTSHHPSQISCPLEAGRRHIGSNMMILPRRVTIMLTATGGQPYSEQPVPRLLAQGMIGLIPRFRRPLYLNVNSDCESGLR